MGKQIRTSDARWECVRCAFTHIHTHNNSNNDDSAERKKSNQVIMPYGAYVYRITNAKELPTQINNQGRRVKQPGSDGIGVVVKQKSEKERNNTARLRQWDTKVHKHIV